MKESHAPSDCFIHDLREPERDGGHDPWVLVRPDAGLIVAHLFFFCIFLEEGIELDDIGVLSTLM